MSPTRTLAGIQVIWSLWEVLDAVNNKRPSRYKCIPNTMLPTSNIAANQKIDVAGRCRIFRNPHGLFRIHVVVLDVYKYKSTAFVYHFFILTHSLFTLNYPQFNKTWFFFFISYHVDWSEEIKTVSHRGDGNKQGDDMSQDLLCDLSMRA